MKSKSLLILGGVAVTAGVAVLIKGYYNAATFSSPPAGVGQPALKDFRPGDVASFIVKDSKKQVEVALKDGKWVVVSRDNFPASITAANEVTDTALALKVQKVETGVGKSLYPRLGLAESGDGVKEEEVGKQLTFKDASGKELAGLTVGKMTPPDFSRETMDLSGPKPAPQWIQVKGVDAVYQTTNGYNKLEGDPKGWLDKDTFFKVEKHKSVTVTGPTPEESWKLTRDTEAGELKLDAPKPGEEFDKDKATSQGSLFSYVSFLDVLPAAEKDKAALDKPLTSVVIETFDGLTYTIKAGAKQPPDESGPEAQFMSFTVTGNIQDPAPFTAPAPAAPAPPAADAKPEDKAKFDEANAAYQIALAKWQEDKRKADEQVEGIKTLKEKLAKEQAIQGRIFIVAKSAFDPASKKRSELLKDKPAAPPAGETPGAGTPAKPKITTLPAPAPKPGDKKIEATTPPIEVTLPGMEPSKEAPKVTPAPTPTPAPEAPKPAPAPATPAPATPAPATPAPATPAPATPAPATPPATPPAAPAPATPPAPAPEAPPAAPAPAAPATPPAPAAPAPEAPKPAQ